MIEKEGLTDSELARLADTIALNKPSGVDISTAEVIEALSADDIADWKKGELSAQMLALFSLALFERKQISQGINPKRYTSKAYCDHCGVIWLWCYAYVLSCPWCYNEEIPRPEPVKCADCRYFKKGDHPNRGRCVKRDGDYWDTDKRGCTLFKPEEKNNG